MKTRISHTFVTLIAWTSGIIAFYNFGSLQAANLYWNPNGTGGDGIWGTSPGEKNWNIIPEALVGNIAWPDTIDDAAFFQSSTGGFVTLSEPLQASGIIQNGANYTIDAGTITLVSNSAAASPFIEVQAGILTIDSVLAGSNGLIKNGGGTLVLTRSNIFSGNTQIGNGTLQLTGSLASTNVSISSGATLLNQNGGLSNITMLTNAGSLTLNSDDAIAGYISNGGIFTAGPGMLSTNNADLNHGSSIAGRLDTDSLTSNGAVHVSSNISANTINITTGTLTNTGKLGNGFTLLNINEGAMLAAGGIQPFALLSTSGSGTGTWIGNLENINTVAPGGMGKTGHLTIVGNFTQAAAGVLKLDLSSTANDLLDVTGNVTFNGTLDLNQLGNAITPFVPITIISASSYTGNITSLSENLDGAVWFNPNNGTVTRVELPAGPSSFLGATRNQISSWISLYDDVIEPGIGNITSGLSGYDISSGIADTNNPNLLWALSASLTPTGLNAALLNRLSPEVYASVSDYAIQATRVHQRSALSAPALDPRNQSMSDIANSVTTLDWEFFAAVDYFHAGTENSNNQANYDFDGMGLLTGARTRPWDQTQLGVYLGVDSGSINGQLIDADGMGLTLGMIGDHLLHEKSQTRLTAGISYGSYLFDGNRGSASATAAGWIPGAADFDNVDVDSLDLFVGVDGVALKQEAFVLIPMAGLRYAMTTMDSFNESTSNSLGSPIALEVNRDRDDMLLLEIGLRAQMEVDTKLSLQSEGGVNVGLLDDDRVLDASFAKGSRTMRAKADGLNDDLIYLGCGAVYQFADDLHFGIGYRADIRSEAELQQEVSLSSSWRF